MGFCLYVFTSCGVFAKIEWKDTSKNPQEVKTTPSQNDLDLVRGLTKSGRQPFTRQSCRDPQDPRLTRDVVRASPPRSEILAKSDLGKISRSMKRNPDGPLYLETAILTLRETSHLTSTSSSDCPTKISASNTTIFLENEPVQK